MNKKILKRASIVLIALAMIVGVVYAANWIYSSPVEVAVGETPELSIHVSPSSVCLGDTVTFTGTSSGLPTDTIVYLCETHVPVAGVTAVTNADGSFVLTWVADSTGIHIFEAGVQIP